MSVKYITFLVVLISCYAANGQGKYYPKTHWYTSSQSLFPVKARPKKVIEYFYKGVDSLMKTDLKKFDSYDEFIYDTAGNLLSRKLFFDDDFWSGFTTSFSDSGLITESQYKSKKGIEKQVFEKIDPDGNGRYKETVYSDKVISRITYYTYKHNGNEVITEDTQKVENYTGYTTNNFLYNGNQLLSQTKKVISGKDTSVGEKFCYYGKDNALDSVITRSGKYKGRLLFIKNEYGDPIAEIEIERNDTTRFYTYTYLYDDKGNWIRRVQQDHIEVGLHSQMERFSMIRREIIY